MPDAQQLSNAFAQVSLWATVLALMLGVLATFTPATFAVAPVVVGYVGSHARSRQEGWGRALAFLGGLSLVNFAVGALFGAAGALAQRLIGGNLALWNGLAGVLTLAVALVALGRLPLPLPGWVAGLPASHSWTGAFALGVPFGLVTCPTCIPLLVPMAIGAARSGSAWYGALLFLAFAIGRGVPLLVLGGATGLFKLFKPLALRMPLVERASAWLLVAAAAYFIVQAVVWARSGMSS